MVGPESAPHDVSVGAARGTRTVPQGGVHMANALQEHYGEWLLDRIRADRYPSVNHMNMLEEIASPRLKEEYTLHLFERIEADTYPSIPMMQRVQRLVARWGLDLPPGAIEGVKEKLGRGDDDDEDRDKEKQQRRSRRRSSSRSRSRTDDDE
jgi:hypothetical protein